MSEQIIDGTGNGFKARVTRKNRLSVQSLALPARLGASDDDRAFSINSGSVVLTGASESGVLYYKNNADDSFRIDAIGIAFETSTGGTAAVKINIIKNPTAGTLITDKTPAPIQSNANFASSVELVGDAFVGGAASTVTDGTRHTYTTQGLSSGALLLTAIVLKKGASVAITFTPPAGNTSMACNAVFLGHFAEDSA